MRATVRIGVIAGFLLAALSVPASARGWHSHHGGWGAWGPWWWGPGPVVVSIDVPAPPRSEPRLTAVKTDVEPEEARVLLDGKLIGVADDFDGFPGFLYLEPGEYTLEFQLPGYQSRTVKVAASPGTFLPVKFELVRKPGEAKLPWWDRPEDLPKSRVFGPVRPVTPPDESRGADLALRPETRDRPAGGTVTAKPGRGAALEVRVKPANAAVYVDGQLAGSGEELAKLERGLSVAPGRHRIEVTAPGLTQRVIEVDLGEGERHQIVVDLGGVEVKTEGVDKRE